MTFAVIQALSDISACSKETKKNLFDESSFQSPLFWNANNVQKLMVNNLTPFHSYAFSNALTPDFITQQLHSYVLSYNL